MKNLLKLSLTLCLAVFLSNIVLGQEERRIVDRAEAPEVYFDVVSSGKLSDGDFEAFCNSIKPQLLNSLDQIDSGTKIKFENDVILILFKQYEELKSFREMVKPEREHTIEQATLLNATDLSKGSSGIINISK